MEEQHNNNLDSIEDGQSSSSQQTPENFPSQPPKKKRTTLRVVAFLLVLIAIASGAFIVLQRHKTTDNNIDSPTPRTAASSNIYGSVFCSKLGLSSLQCENLDTKEVWKYTLPESLGEISYLSTNPDRTKYYIDAYSPNSPTFEHTYNIYDQKFNLLGSLPFQADPSGKSSVNPAYIHWLDTDRLVYSKYDSSSAPTGIKLYSYDVTKKQESELVSLNVNLEYYIPTPDHKHLYGLQSYSVPEENATKRKLVVINLETKEVKDVEGGQVDTDTFSYNADTGLLYKNILHTEQQTNDIKIYRVDNLESSPKLTEIQTITNKYAAGVLAYETVVTNRGLFVTDTFLVKKAPYKFYADDGIVTEATLAAGYSGVDIMLTLPGFPDLTRASSDEPVVSEFFKAPAGTPEKIDKFLEKMAMDTTECGANNYTTLTLQQYDSDKQFGVIVSSCKQNGLVIYNQDGDSYKQIYFTQEGIDCSERDKLGISPKVLECRQPGEGL